MRESTLELLALVIGDVVEHLSEQRMRRRGAGQADPAVAEIEVALLAELGDQRTGDAHCR